MEENLIWSDSTEIKWNPATKTFERRGYDEVFFRQSLKPFIDLMLDEIEKDNKTQLEYFYKGLSFRSIAARLNLLVILLIFILTIVGASLESWECFIVLILLYFLRATVVNIVNLLYFRSGIDSSCKHLLASSQKIFDKYNQTYFTSEKIAGRLLLRESNEHVIYSDQKYEDFIKIRHTSTAGISVELRKKR